VEDDDESYMRLSDDPVLAADRRQHILSGSCAFKTCSRSLRIPASYFISLLRATYDPSTELKDARTAVHHWLLVQILDAIGNYNTL